MAKNDFQWRMEFLHLHCGMWLWNRDSEFTKWQHTAMWYVALVSISTTSPQSKFYPNRTTLSRKKMTSCRFSRWRIWAILDFRGPIMVSLKTQLQHSTFLSFPENCVFAFWRQDPRWRISAILDFMNPMASLINPRTTSYRSTVDTAALNFLVFLENRVFLHFGDRQTNRQTDKRTNRWTAPMH